jgi:hypothetical protein
MYGHVHVLASHSHTIGILFFFLAYFLQWKLKFSLSLSLSLSVSPLNIACVRYELVGFSKWTGYAEITEKKKWRRTRKNLVVEA